MKSVMKLIFIFLIQKYQAHRPARMNGVCIYTPSCSAYAIVAIEKFGAWRGGYRAVKRICRCNTMSGGGVDLP
ncbi:MAG: membrane protein insertion efficiency factor YidD [Bacteroidota bacterium]